MIEPITLEMNEDDIFALHDLDIPVPNRRKVVRYVREDIQASLEKPSLFGNKPPIASKLLDISTKGALLATGHQFRIKAKVVLHLTFDKGKSFTIPGRIIHRISASAPTYGMEFRQIQHDLGDYMLATQSDLVFK